MSEQGYNDGRQNVIDWVEELGVSEEDAAKHSRTRWMGSSTEGKFSGCARLVKLQGNSFL
jgi:hypothetical protein